MPLRLCRVTYIDRSGVAHTAEVEAESLYEAVALAVAESGAMRSPVILQAS